MTLGQLVGTYFAVGTITAAFVYSRSERRRSDLASAALTVVLWPLWAPVALGPQRRAGDRDDTIRGLLDEGVRAAVGTAYETMLNRPAAERVAVQAERAQVRLAKLREVLGSEAYEVEALHLRLERLKTTGGSRRAVETARLHLENVRRMRALADRDEAALLELRELLGALRTQLVLARFADETPSRGMDVDGIVQDVWTRVETLEQVALHCDPSAARDALEELRESA